MAKKPKSFSIEMGRSVIPPEALDKNKRKEWGLPEDPDKPGDYMIELNLLHKRGLQEADSRFLELFKDVLGKSYVPKRRPQRVSKTYYRCAITVPEWQALIERDQQSGPPDERAIYRIWPDFKLEALMYRSIATIKADAAMRSYGASGSGITWAVIDSGIDANHPHFGDAGAEDNLNHALLNPNVADLHRDFHELEDPEYATVDSDSATDEDLAKRRQELLVEHRQRALTDELGHGTHVAGIIAGGLTAELADKIDIEVYERTFSSDPDGKKVRESFERRASSHWSQLRGVAPGTKLVSLKVLDKNGHGRASNVIRALTYIRESLNSDPKLLRVQGVNLSVGYEFEAELFACGQSPICVEVDRLVREGVVVVAAAGNTGYGRLQTSARVTRVGLSNTINDPGNAEYAITVGATHCDAPYTYGVSYFSSKGPTGDGREKPDLVAPGERIMSCAAGAELKNVLGERGTKSRPVATYLDASGTSMAAPHVSGAIAAFLSIRREFIGKPLDVKRIFLDSATSLGRDHYLEGHGLVDVMRAIQSV
jgi:subtilisin family serine protease